MGEAQGSGPDGAIPRALTTVRIDHAAITRLRTGPDGHRDVELGSVRGWAVGPEPLARIDVLLNDRFVATARIGDARPDIAILFPEIPHAEQAGFEAILTGGRLPADVGDVVLRLQTATGRSLTVTHPLTIADAGADLDHLPIRMAVDDCAVDPHGHLHLSGWALSKAPIAAIQVFIGGQHFATVLPHRTRPDVAARFPGYGNIERCGFELDRPLPPRWHAAQEPIRIEIMARDGATRSMVAPARYDPAPSRISALHCPPALSHPIVLEMPRLAPVRARPRDPDLQFHCDSITLATDGSVSITGWAAASTSIKGLSIFLDETPLGEAQLGLVRPDVGRAFPSLQDSAKAGFALDAAVPGPLQGAYDIRFELRLADGSRRSFAETAAATDQTQIRVGSEADDVMLAVDGLQIAAGHAARRITGAFHLVGWATARVGVADVEVFLDETSLGRAYHGLRREDVAKTYPLFPGSLRAGFALSIPSRALRPGRSQIRVVVTARDSARAETCFSIDIDLAAQAGSGPALRRRISAAELATHLAILTARGPLPLCDLVLRVPAGQHSRRRALATLGSLVSQGYPAWRLWLSPLAGQDGDEIRRALHAVHPDYAARVRPLQAYEQPTGSSLAGMLVAGDVLAADGLLAMALAAGGPQAGDLVYGDDCRLDAGARQPAAFFKPDWSPDLLLSQNYIGRAWLARGEVLSRAGLDLPGIVACGEYGALLRLTESAGVIRHVPQLVLRATSARAVAVQERRALMQALRRRGILGKVEAGRSAGLHRMRRDPSPAAKVSIVIPSIAAKGHIRACIESIRRVTRGVAYEIVVVDNLRSRALPAEQQAWKAWFRSNADIVVSDDAAFNWSKLNNQGAAAATGDYLLFLNDDIEVRQHDWLAVLVAEAGRPEVGVVGAQLLYPDGKVQHAGMTLSRAKIGSAGHAFRFADRDDPGYFGLALSQRNVACVTGACMMMRRGVFMAAGGFDEAHGVVNNDVDFCLRLHDAGKLIVYTPHVQLTHHELASRAALKDSYDRSAFLERWGDICLAGDPFHNRNLDPEVGDFAIDEEPLREVYAGHPLGRRDQVKRILAVKLDHIGDLVTALPALRRLKSHFPEARLDALVGASAVTIARLEPTLGEVIPFAFFEARSSLGQRPMRKADYARLEADLRARRYDLAIDLRKLGDTRHVLQLSHAPILAGFDHDRRFPWLDIALEWEGDALQTRKRNHVADDLLNLADAVGNAFGEDRHTLSRQSQLPALSDELAGNFPELFKRDYVVVHPAAGSALRQWQPTCFARLIDLLIEHDGMRIALVGGPDERHIAGEVLGQVRNSAAVFNLVGRSRLAELPEIIARSVLFVGNNSGPSHIASGLGVPTVAVHSAIVASEEWGPLGPAAVALRRDMSCAPCYIVSVDQCHRGMACLTSLTPHAVHAVCQRFLSLRGSPAASLAAAGDRADEPLRGCHA